MIEGALAPTIVVGVMATSMLVFAALGQGRRPDPGDSDKGGFVLGVFTRRWFYWFIRPLERLAIRFMPWPIVFNLTGAAFGALAGVFFGFGMVAAGGWCVLAGGTADVFDGRVARALGIASRRGAFLDSTLDRFAEVGAFAGLAVLVRGSPLAVAAVAIGLGGSLLVSYTRARGEAEGIKCRGGLMQRAERIIAVGCGAVLDRPVTALVGWEEHSLLLGLLAVVALGTVATAAYRTIWIARRLS